MSECASDCPGTDEYPAREFVHDEGTTRPKGVFKSQDFVLLRYDPNDSDPGDFCGRRGLFGQNGISFISCQDVGGRLCLRMWQMRGRGFYEDRTAAAAKGHLTLRPYLCSLRTIFTHLYFAARPHERSAEVPIGRSLPDLFKALLI